VQFNEDRLQPQAATFQCQAFSSGGSENRSQSRDPQVTQGLFNAVRANAIAIPVDPLLFAGGKRLCFCFSNWLTRATFLGTAGVSNESFPRPQPPFSILPPGCLYASSAVVYVLVVDI